LGCLAKFVANLDGRDMIAAMRLFLLALFGVLTIGPAHADQTDPRLDRLFENLRTGEGEDAETLVAEIQAIWSESQSDTVDLLSARAADAAAAGEKDLAASLLDHAIGLSPSFMQAYALRGSLRVSEGDQPGALSDFYRAIELEPRQFDVRIALGELAAAAGDKRAAYDHFQKALEWNPHEPHARARAASLRSAIDGSEI
jgi:tetratricopeptide (TPR) repeat protein